MRLHSHAEQYLKSFWRLSVSHTPLPAYHLAVLAADKLFSLSHLSYFKAFAAIVLVVAHGKQGSTHPIVLIGGMDLELETDDQ